MIRIGVICPSEIAFRRFLPSLKLAEDFDYVGVAIASKEEFVGATDEILAKERQKAQTFVDNYGGKIFEGYGTLISSEEIDAIYLPLPPALHFKWAEKALLNNKHVFVEKPSTTCLKDTQRLVELAKERNLALHEDYMFVYHNQLEAINDIVRSGELGEVRLYRITFGFPRRDAKDFRYNKALGGGALLDAGGYTMKYATTLLGLSGKLVAATANYLPDFEVDMYGSATMVNDDGDVVEYSPAQIKYRCEQMGVNTVMEFETFIIPDDVDPGEYVVRKVEQYFDGPDPIGKTHIREGVVARILNRNSFAVYKHKNFSFKVLEGIAKDEATAPDIEEAQEELTE